MTSKLAISPAKTTKTAKNKGHSYWTIYIWVLTYLKPYASYVAGFVGCGVMLAGAELLVPRFIQILVDHVLPERNIQLFLWLIGGLGAILLFRVIANIGKNMLQRHFTEKASRDLQLSVLQKLRKLGYAYYEKHPVGETLAFFHTETAAVQRLYSDLLPAMILSGIMLLLSVVMLLSIHMALSLVVLPSLALYYITGHHFDKRAASYRKETNDVRTEVNSRLYNSVSGQAEIRINGTQSWDIECLLEKQIILNKVEHKMWVFVYARIVSRTFAVYLGILAFFAVGSHLVMNGQLSLGAFLAFSLYYFDVAFGITRIINNLTTQKALLFQAERIHDFMQETPVVQEATETVILDKVRGEFQFNNVHFGYNQDRLVLNGFDLHIRSGQKVALVGASGNGKSTLLKLIGRFYDPQQGDIRLDGKPLRMVPLSALRRSIGFVFQETYLFGSSIKENIRFGKLDATDEELMQAAKAANAHDFIMQLAEGYDTLVGERGVKLSGGQRQRIAIARMFIKQPAVILLDEATSALDTASESEVQNALRELLTGRTTIAVAHRLSTIRDYDVIVVIDGGKVVESGSYTELMQRKGALYQLESGHVAMTVGGAV